MKRKLLAVLLALSLCVCLFSGAAFAADDEPVKELPEEAAEEVAEGSEDTLEAMIQATISVAGELVLPHWPVLVTDVDEDEALTVYDALVAVHETYCEEEDPFTVADGFITKFWGVENGGAYMYYLNNVMCGGITDPIQDGDELVAYAFADTEGWSDMYTYFNTTEVDVAYGEDVSLQLFGLSFDENWNTVEVPVAGAVITIDGEETEFVTDEEGKVTFTLPVDSYEAYYEISAKCEDKVIVPPAADVWVDYDNYHEHEFADVAGHWAEDDIYDCVEGGLLNGVSETEFAPNVNVSRAMMAAVLYRLEDEPEIDAENIFSDVEADTWYTDAVIWAADEGLVKGDGVAFRPNDAMTRSEAAVILYRWYTALAEDVAYLDAIAELADELSELDSELEIETLDDVLALIEEDEELQAKLDALYEENLKEFTSVLLNADENALAGYTDAGDIPEWAEEAMAWAVTKGILTGTSETTIAPQMTLTRAQLAVILMRL